MDLMFVSTDNIEMLTHVVVVVIRFFVHKWIFLNKNSNIVVLIFNIVEENIIGIFSLISRIVNNSIALLKKL